MSGFPFVMKRLLLGYTVPSIKPPKIFTPIFLFIIDYIWFASLATIYPKIPTFDNVCESECIFFGAPSLCIHTNTTHTLDQMCMCIVCQLLKRTASLASIYHHSPLFFSHLEVAYTRSNNTHCDIWTPQTNTQRLGWFFSVAVVVVLLLLLSFIRFFIFLYLFGRHSIMDECKPYIDTIIVHPYTCIHTQKRINISYIEILLQFVAVARLLACLLACLVSHALLSLSTSAIIFRDIIRMYCVILCWW